MPESIATVLSSLALAISAFTAWLTFFRRGTVRSTKPTVFYFGPDGNEVRRPKVFLRALLFANSKRGRVIESLHLTLKRDATRQGFSVWVYGDKQLVRGSGLFVGETGFAANHHFLLSSDGANFTFLPGDYDVELIAKFVGSASSKVLLKQRLSLTPDLASAIGDGAGVYFDWVADADRYVPHIERRPKREPPLDPLAELMVHGNASRAGFGHP